MAGKGEESDNASGIQRMWAPWRLEYIKGQSPADAKNPAPTKVCPFCELPKQEPSHDNLVLYKDDDLFVIMNRYPYNPSHLLVIPRQHLGKPEELAIATWKRLSRALQICLEILQEGPTPQGFNIGMNIGSVGGAGIPDHLHWHIVPRWAGDTNFMPLLAETKALPVHNQTIWEELAPRFLDFGRKLQET